MTLVVVVIIGAGIILIASALDNTPILTTIRKIANNQPIDWTGAKHPAPQSGGGSGGQTKTVIPPVFA